MLEIIDELLTIRTSLDIVEHEEYNDQLHAIDRRYTDEINPCSTARAQAQQRSIDRPSLDEPSTKTPR